METIRLSEYILRSRDKRTTHIDLATPCEGHEERMGKQSNKELFKALCLLHGIDNDILNRAKANIHVCHLCSEKHCQNPRHAYLGTHSENWMDVPKPVRLEIAKKRATTTKQRRPTFEPRQKNKADRKPRRARKEAKSRRTETLRFALVTLGVENKDIERILAIRPLPGLLDALELLG